MTEYEEKIDLLERIREMMETEWRYREDLDTLDGVIEDLWIYYDLRNS